MKLAILGSLFPVALVVIGIATTSNLGFTGPAMQTANDEGAERSKAQDLYRQGTERMNTSRSGLR